MQRKKTKKLKRRKVMKKRWKRNMNVCIRKACKITGEFCLFTVEWKQCQSEWQAKMNGCLVGFDWELQDFSWLLWIRLSGIYIYFYDTVNRSAASLGQNSTNHQGDALHSIHTSTHVEHWSNAQLNQAHPPERIRYDVVNVDRIWSTLRVVRSVRAFTTTSPRYVS